jgi:hypothetical protein
MNICISCSISVASFEVFARGYNKVPNRVMAGKKRVKPILPKILKPVPVDHATKAPAINATKTAGAENFNKYSGNGIPSRRIVICHVVSFVSMNIPHVS